MQIFKSTLNTRTILQNDLKYIRSDVPTAVSEHEREWLLSNGITNVIDLRTDREATEKPCPLKSDCRFHYYSFPIACGDSVPTSPDGVSASYIRMVDERFEKLIDFLLNTSCGTLYFCNAGKDRTGVVSAALLHRLGQSVEYIVCDYMKSKSNLEGLLNSYERMNSTVDIKVVTPNERYIREFLIWYIDNVE